MDPSIVGTRSIPDHPTHDPRTPENEHTDRTLISTIKELFDDSWAASYVEEIVIHGYSHHLMPWEGYRMEESKALKEEAKDNIKLLESLIVNSRYLQNLFSRDPTLLVDALEEIQEGDEDCLIALLFTLPNVDTVHFKPYWKEPYVALDTVDQITQDESPTALTLLTRVVIDGEYGRKDLGPIITFAKVPSLRICHADKISDMHRPWPDERDIYRE